MMKETTRNTLKELGSNSILAPSILSADFSNLISDIQEVEKAGVRWLHVDVMDGHFVPNMTIGSVVVESLRKKTTSILDCHLMVNNPELFVPWFAKAGADFITIHSEATKDLGSLLSEIRLLGCGAGVSIKPATSLNEILPHLEKLDLVLIMSVNPGFGGQSFMSEVLDKVRALAKIKKDRGLNFLIEIDGGINTVTARQSKEAGVEVFVAGNSVFGQKDRALAIKLLNEAIKSNG